MSTSIASKPILSFSSATFKKIREYFDVQVKYSEIDFRDWFSFSYDLSKAEQTYLDDLIRKHRLKLPAYLEEKLKAKFIIPILNLVDFYTSELDDWYEVELYQAFEHVILKGNVDFLVAQGSEIPEVPYFFIQEFKYSFPDKDPKYQLLAEMIAALAQNPSDEMKGCFIVGPLWYFTRLIKVDNQYEYFISPGFDALSNEDLYQIYSNLQAVKAEALAVNITDRDLT